MQKRFRVPGRLALKLKEHGVSVAAVLRKAGLPGDLFEQTRVLVSTEELFALWHSIEVVSSDPLIGIKLGVETKTERFHPMAIAALSTQNLVTATEHLARYKKLTAPEEILSKLGKQEFSIAYRWLLAVEAEPQVLTDYCFSWTISLVDTELGHNSIRFGSSMSSNSRICVPLSAASAARWTAVPRATRSSFAHRTQPHPL
jgi:Arabinose-binding domain of AraC transcription regulator, N-term